MRKNWIPNWPFGINHTLLLQFYHFERKPNYSSWPCRVLRVLQNARHRIVIWSSTIERAAESRKRLNWALEEPLAESMERKWEETLPELDSISLDVLENGMVTGPIRSFLEVFGNCQVKTTCPNDCRTAQEGPFTDDVRGTPSILCNIDGESSRNTEWEPEVQQRLPKNDAAARGRRFHFSMSVSQGARPEQPLQWLVYDGKFESTNNHLRREKPHTKKSSFLILITPG